MTGSWSPAVGRLAEDLMDGQNLDEGSKERLVETSLRTLSRCGSPEEEGPHRGVHLVVGQIQSGKTLAFTTLMALARDNGFRLIIVLGGTKKNLVSQTVARLKDDLLKGTGSLNPWRVWPDPDAGVADEVNRVLGTRRDPEARVDGTRTAVFFVLKHGTRLQNLRETLEAIDPTVLSRTPALIIDDEADQASLNLFHDKGKESSIYGSIGWLRGALPRHDLMMYTATPQGPLLVGLGDELSPETVTVLDTGPGYVGGSELFIEGRNHYLTVIPDREIEATADPSAGAPPSLRRAIATFLLALVIAQDRRHPRPLSMLIHPAASRDLHDRYAGWAEAIRSDLVARLDNPDDVAFADALEADFEKPYEDLARTVDDIPPLEELAEVIPPYAQQVEIQVVNAGSPPIEDWNDFPGWIVVGGNKLERGFTIKNLAITYMSRGPGAKNVDTIQQRGRFFGYKGSYLDLCRGWFSADVADIYDKNVGHEDALRKALALVDQGGKPLRSWRRELLLSPSLQPTRRRVVSLDTERYVLTRKDRWFRQARPFDREAARENRVQVHSLLDRFRGAAEVERRDPRERHHAAQVPLVSLYETLAEWEAVSEDYERLLGLSLVLALMLDSDASAESRLVFMDGFRSLSGAEARRRTRTDSPGPEMTAELFQGEDAGTRYPGDHGIFDPALVSVQLHLLNLFERDGTLWEEAVPAIAVHLPSDAPNLILQR